MKSINPSGSRIDLHTTDSVDDILLLVAERSLKVLQFFEPLSPKFLTALNDEFFSRRPDVQLRAYGFYRDVCNLSFCSRMSNVESFAADAIQHAVGIEHIANMTRLKSLSIGIFHLDSFAVLNDVSPDISKLSLLATKSKKPDLAVLSRFRDLRRLYLEAQQKNIDVLSNHQELEDLTLRSITLKSLGLMRTIPKLSSLDLKLGGTKNLAELDGFETIKYLELWKILGLEDISVVSTLRGLQSLFLQDLPRISSVPKLDQLHKLRRIHLEGMTGLTNLSALGEAPALEEVVHVGATKLLPEDYLPILQSKTLKRASVGFGSSKKNEHFKELCKARGISCSVDREFAIL